MRPRLLPLQSTLATGLLLSSCVLLSHPRGPQVQSPALDELSGLAVSHADPQLLWGHNDSGDSARLFRIGADGADLGQLSVPGAEAVDWEDVAAFDWQGAPALLIGDVGDNRAARPSVMLYAANDPGRDGGALRLLWKLRLRYPDGPRDCEAVAVDPADRAVILLSKRDHPQHLYRVPLPAESAAGDANTTIDATAELLGTITSLPRAGAAELIENPLYSQFDGPTALDIAPSGRFAVVTTYENAFLYRRAEGQSWLQAFSATPETIAVPPLKQAEAGAIAADGVSLFVSGEGRHPPLLKVSLPH